MQWHLKMLREEDEDFERETKQRYQDQKAKRRRERRKWLKKELQAKLEAMPEDERKDYEHRRAARSERMRDDEKTLLKDAIMSGRIDLYEINDEDYKAYRKDLRKQIREYRKNTSFESDDDDVDYGRVKNIEDKIYYGSDTMSEDFSRPEDEEQEIRAVGK